MSASDKPNDSQENSPPFTTHVIQAGLIAGILDGMGAILTFMLRGGKNPVSIFKFIASGVFGKSALTGGMGIALMGLIFHLAIATIWATFFFLACRRWTWLYRNWIGSGISYGVLVWLGMNLVVVPLSGTPKLSHSVIGVIIALVVLILCVGLPISYRARKHFS